MPRDIEEFLRMAAERRKQQMGQMRGQEGQAPGPQQPRPGQPGQQRRPAQAQPEIVFPTESSEVIEAQISEPVARLVGGQRQADSGQADRRSERLSPQPRRGEERGEHRFDRALGRLVVQEQAAVAQSVAAALADEIRVMMQSEHDIRKAFVLQEILRRPSY